MADGLLFEALADPQQLLQHALDLHAARVVLVDERLELLAEVDAGLVLGDEAVEVRGAELVAGQ